jgi:hypothetical protein
MTSPSDARERETPGIASTNAEPIPTYMGQAVLVTLLCFPFTGAMAILHASQVVSRMQVGDLDGAKLASRKARRMVWLSVILGFVMIAATVLGGLALTLYLAAMLENP